MIEKYITKRKKFNFSVDEIKDILERIFKEKVKKISFYPVISIEPSDMYIEFTNDGEREIGILEFLEDYYHLSICYYTTSRKKKGFFKTIGIYGEFDYDEYKKEKTKK